MSHHQCLNCGEQLNGNYCHHCGQKATTHRFTLSHVFSHDLVHGVMHVDKGIMYTIQQLIVRPGYSVREFVEGKRAYHFNYVTLMLLLIATMLFISVTGGITPDKMVAGMSDKNPSGVQVFSGMWQFIMSHMKELSIASVLAYSTSSFLVFRKARQNFAEHLVMNCYRECGAMMISILFMLSFLVPMGAGARGLTSMAGLLLMYFYNYRFYMQYFKPDYSNKQYLAFLVMWSQAVMVLLICVGIAVILATMIAMGTMELKMIETGGFTIIYKSAS